jgi:ABC-type multidrug transport system fused ATPase/permease subunit
MPAEPKASARRTAIASGVAEMPSNIFRYVLETSGLHQLFLLLLTVGVFLLEVVPLELQRRIVNDLVKHREYRLVITLCAVYAGTVLVQGGTKLVLNLYRSWIGERATRDLRRRIHVLVSSPSSASTGSEAQGIQASMIVAEVEPIGGFVGTSVSEPLLQGGVMISVLAYMISIFGWRARRSLPTPVGLRSAHARRDEPRTGARVQIIRNFSIASFSDRPRRRADHTDDSVSTAYLSSTWESFASSSQ